MKTLTRNAYAKVNLAANHMDVSPSVMISTTISITVIISHIVKPIVTSSCYFSAKYTSPMYSAPSFLFYHTAHKSSTKNKEKSVNFAQI